MVLDAQGRAVVAGGFKGRFHVGRRSPTPEGWGQQAGLYLARIEASGEADLAVVLAENTSGLGAQLGVVTGGDLVISPEGALLLCKPLWDGSKRSQQVRLRDPYGGGEHVLETKRAATLLAKVSLLD